MTDAPARQLAGTVIEALNIEASALFLLRVMGPRAARAVLFTAASAMEDAIRAENAETEYLQ
jgi:hypothetical protein